MVGADAVSANHEDGAARALCCLLADAGEGQRGGEVAAAENQQPGRGGRVGQRFDRRAWILDNGGIWAELLAREAGTGRTCVPGRDEDPELQR